jgi:hypothetical protein
MIDRSHYTPEQCQKAADSIEKVGGAYLYLAAAIRHYNPIKEDMYYYEIREDGKLIAIRNTIEEADALITKLSFTGKHYVVSQAKGELKYRNKGETNE